MGVGLAAPEEAVRLELVEGNTRIKAMLAAEDRPDLALFGCGNGSHEFEFQIGRSAARRGDMFSPCVPRYRQIIPGSPLIVSRERPALPPPVLTPTKDTASGLSFLSFIDGVSSRGVSRLVMIPDRPSHRCAVHSRSKAGFRTNCRLAVSIRSSVSRSGDGSTPSTCSLLRC